MNVPINWSRIAKTLLGMPKNGALVILEGNRMINHLVSIMQKWNQFTPTSRYKVSGEQLFAAMVPWCWTHAPLGPEWWLAWGNDFRTRVDQRAIEIFLWSLASDQRSQVVVCPFRRECTQCWRECRSDCTRPHWTPSTPYLSKNRSIIEEHKLNVLPISGFKRTWPVEYRFPR